MSIAELAQTMASRLAEWWRDRPDERLDALIGRDYGHVGNEADKPGVTAYELAARARKSTSA